jgi:thioesterase domain-containing protein
LEAPTVEQFAAWLRKDEGNNQQVLVRIRPGTSVRPPFFCIHASDGTAVGMQPLARAMDEDLPFYCLQAKGLDGSAPFATMEEAAEYCLNEIRKVQPHGPYYLGGYCFGGFVAFEIARTLEQLGESVPTLIMIDSFNPAYLRFKPTTKMLFSLAKFYVRRVGMHGRKMRKVHPGGWIGYAGGRFRAMYVHIRRFRTRLAQVKAKQNPPDPSQVEIAPAVNADFDQLLERLVKVGPSLASKFVPKPYRGSAVVFRVSERSDDPYDDYFLGWKSVIRGPMESFEIEAAHETILREPAVLSLAEIIDAKLRESSAATPNGLTP